VNERLRREYTGADVRQKRARALLIHFVQMKRLDRSAEFVHHLEALRTKYKIKRNFIKLVEQKRKSLYL